MSVSIAETNSHNPGVHTVLHSLDTSQTLAAFALFNGLLFTPSKSEPSEGSEPYSDKPLGETPSLELARCALWAAKQLGLDPLANLNPDLRPAMAPAELEEAYRQADWLVRNSQQHKDNLSRAAAA